VKLRRINILLGQLKSTRSACSTPRLLGLLRPVVGMGVAQLTRTSLLPHTPLLSLSASMQVRLQRSVLPFFSP